MDYENYNQIPASIIQDIKRQFTSFIQNFDDAKYVRLSHMVLQQGKRLLVIENKDFIHYNADLAKTIYDEYYRYEEYLNEAFSQFMNEQERNLMFNEEGHKEEPQKQKYYITFDRDLIADSLRQLKCHKLGKLTCLQGTITRTTEVRPQLIVGIFKCKACGTFSGPVRQQFKYTEPKRCFGYNCDRRQWELDYTKSQFADFQKLRVQEDPTKIPPGAMPRSLDVIIRNDNVEKGQPGDVCKFVGYLCVVPQLSSMFKPGQKTVVSSRNLESRGNYYEMDGITGVKGIRELNYKLMYISTNIVVENNSFNEELEQQEEETYQQNTPRQEYNEQKIFSKVFEKLSENQIQNIKSLKTNHNLYEDMANSLFPAIFGQPEIKKALLLQLFGGIHKVTRNKINIRGDINVLIVGDPSTAKSQFLKCVNKFVPRSVYTNGKTTSAAGLTASVSKDENGHVGIEAGALMLADNGICCIDEFDKMEIKDQVAIHEAMEQQTISIAKAGVHATLNARTSILAAANPVFGRYDKSKSLKQNINLSAPIMSRFDLFFIICDESNEIADMHLSEFVLNMHIHKDRAFNKKYDTKELKTYISTARKIKPRLTIQSAELLRKCYIELRNSDKTARNTSYRITVRQLQSMIRLSEAFARLHFDLYVKEEYVREAFRLISQSIMKLEKSQVQILTQEFDTGLNLTDNRVTQIMSSVAMKKEQTKKNKSIAVSHEMYQEILKNAIGFFKEQEERQGQGALLSQNVLVDYLLAINFENNMLNSEIQTIQMKKVINAIVRKMIHEQRTLMIVEDNEDLSRKMLRIHPNYLD